MGPRNTKKFLFENRESFIRLSEIIKEADTVKRNKYDKYTPEVRALAIELLEQWIKTEFALSGEDNIQLPTKNDDNLYLRLEEEAFK